eukprot:GFKZ01007949.1.p1 GENE.GFKZ01007949.1~~GFKZ01007949.1.p1  ORF type:complete len:213 (-),score=3.02 GFKZ01007949.1:270-908(-)
MLAVSHSIFSVPVLLLAALLLTLPHPSLAEGPATVASLRQGRTPGCPCQCVNAKSSEEKLCQNASPECIPVLCQPRTSSFACCHPDYRTFKSASQTKSSTPFRNPASIRQAGRSAIARDVRRIERDSKPAAQANPDLATSATEILARCEEEIRIIQEDDSSTLSVSQAQDMDLSPSRQSSSRITFSRLASVSRQTLSFVISNLRRHLRRATR